MNQGRAICTIIAKNYLAFARTLAQSFLAFHPEDKCYVLVVDDFAGYIEPADERFEIVRLSELNIPNLRDFCFKYDVTELCTAVKAHLLAYLLREKQLRSLLYLDPDILVTAPLDEMYRRLGTYDIVLTPHLDADYPDDGLLPDDGYILRAGQFNLGFIGVNASDNARSFLKWWQAKLYKRCIVDLLNGYFVDQKFIDFVPIFFQNFLVETGVGYNVAYWNLHSRRVSYESGVWKCNGDGPLYFFHFSGYDPQRDALSSHIPDSLARHRLPRSSDLGKLFAHYQERLSENGYAQSRCWPYTFGYFKTGEPISDEVRSYYRSLPERTRSFSDPFDSDALKRRAVNDDRAQRARLPTTLGATQGVTAPTPAEQLNAILNSRAWRWVSRYGRFKDGYLTPVLEIFRRPFKTQRAAARHTERR